MTVRKAGKRLSEIGRNISKPAVVLLPRFACTGEQRSFIRDEFTRAMRASPLAPLREGEAMCAAKSDFRRPDDDERSCR
ncbi:hypothetical protein [Paraburkholderia sp. DGU8]|jgi:hypothetical protein|uniref:hypothetical protein n=1 Tax=Paraburkholderia sp. DGU8 TaxID=3161997 RepID=UPI003466EBD4